MVLVCVASEDGARTGPSFPHPTPPTALRWDGVMEPSKGDRAASGAEHTIDWGDGHGAQARIGRTHEARSYTTRS